MQQGPQKSESPILPEARAIAGVHPFWQQGDSVEPTSRARSSSVLRVVGDIEKGLLDLVALSPDEAGILLDPLIEQGGCSRGILPRKWLDATRKQNFLGQRLDSVVLNPNHREVPEVGCVVSTRIRPDGSIFCALLVNKRNVPRINILTATLVADIVFLGGGRLVCGVCLPDDSFTKRVFDQSGFVPVGLRDMKNASGKTVRVAAFEWRTPMELAHCMA